MKTLLEFIQQTAIIREGLPTDLKFFITYLEKEDVAFSVRPITLANWIKSAIQAAGVNTTQFEAHSIRSASSTKAADLGHHSKRKKTCKLELEF
jgi:hypothetical protein